MKADIYERITNRIVAELEQGARLWLKPWTVEHAAGRITRPLRFNGMPYPRGSLAAQPGRAAWKLAKDGAGLLPRLPQRPRAQQCSRDPVLGPAPGFHSTRDARFAVRLWIS